MVFVTVGSQRFQFNRLLRAVDDCAHGMVFNDGVFAQTGYCSYEPQNIDHVAFLARSEFAAMVESAELVITHGGTGAIVCALKAGKRVVSMPRLAKYGEHVDNHQVEIVSLFADAGLIVPCFEESLLNEACQRALQCVSVYFESNTSKFVENLDSYLSGLRVSEDDG